MRENRPSITARFVALTRADLDRPELPTGDATAEVRLYRSLGSFPLLRPSAQWRHRLERRTGFFDRATLAALEDGVAQVVIIGAGYDGRPLRFATPGVQWFEVDHPSTQADKRSRLESLGISTPNVAFVPIDLTTGDLPTALRAGGFDRGKPALFIVEGLLGYLPRTTVVRLLSELRTLAAPHGRSALSVPLVAPKASGLRYLRGRLRRALISALGEPQLTRFSSDEVDALLKDAGWRPVEQSGSSRSKFGPRGVLVVCEPAA